MSLAIRASLEQLHTHGVPPALIAALSGGADSLALTLALTDVASRQGIPVYALTIDHGLREDSAHEARLAAGLAAHLGAIPQVIRVHVGEGSGPEGDAREARLSALRAVSLEYAAPVLLGHTMDDQAETVLLRLARGSGVSSLRAMAPIARDEAGATWVRPLLGLRRQATHEACAQAGLTPVLDPTNAPDGPWKAADGSPLRRNALRHSALPALAAALGVDPVPALARTAALAGEDDDALNAWAALLGEEAQNEEGTHKAEWASAAPRETRQGVRVHPLVRVPASVRRRVLKKAARHAGIGALSAVHLHELERLITHWSGQGPVFMHGGKAQRLGKGKDAHIVFTVLR